MCVLFVVGKDSEAKGPSIREGQSVQGSQKPASRNRSVLLLLGGWYFFADCHFGWDILFLLVLTSLDCFEFLLDLDLEYFIELKSFNLKNFVYFILNVIYPDVVTNR